MSYWDEPPDLDEKMERYVQFRGVEIYAVGINKRGEGVIYTTTSTGACRAYNGPSPSSIFDARPNPYGITSGFGWDCFHSYHVPLGDDADAGLRRVVDQLLDDNLITPRQRNMAYSKLGLGEPVESADVVNFRAFLSSKTCSSLEGGVTVNLPYDKFAERVTIQAEFARNLWISSGPEGNVHSLVGDQRFTVDDPRVYLGEQNAEAARLRKILGETITAARQEYESRHGPLTPRVQARLVHWRQEYRIG